MLKRLLAIMVVVLVAGAAMHRSQPDLTPATETAVLIAIDLSDGGANQPCSDAILGCIDGTGCVLANALLAPSSELPRVAVLSAMYTFSNAALDGRSVKPELPPPILLA